MARTDSPPQRSVLGVGSSQIGYTRAPKASTLETLGMYANMMNCPALREDPGVRYARTAGLNLHG